jgi:hypothetical protein
MIDYNNIRQCANYAGKMETPSIRRKSRSELIYWLQDIELDLNYHPGNTGLNKLIYESRTAREIVKELKRRENMNQLPNTIPNNNIIEAIKERADIAEVLSQFTQVFTHKRQWSYRCTLHGADKHPSGLIYRDTNKAWCHVCNKGGDVIDMVELFGKTDKSGAIRYLAKFYGISTNVLPVLQKKGGIKIN